MTHPGLKKKKKKKIKKKRKKKEKRTQEFHRSACESLEENQRVPQFCLPVLACLCVYFFEGPSGVRGSAPMGVLAFLEPSGTEGLHLRVSS